MLKFQFQILPILPNKSQYPRKSGIPPQAIQGVGQNPKLKNRIWIWDFGFIWALVVFGFGIFLGLVLLCSHVYALDLDKVKVNFLNGDYKAAIQEGEKVLANFSAHTSGMDELYYILGLAYLEDGNYLRASDIFEIILKEFRNSAFQDKAKLSLGDTYFLRGNYDKAQVCYNELLSLSPQRELKSLLYYRLSQAGLKKGDMQIAREYLDKLKSEFPSSIEIRLNKDLYSLSDIYYTVQVGSFLKSANARNLCDKLMSRGYDAYVQETDNNNTKMYRVKVGRLKSRPEAVQLEEKLSSEGYPTKIYP